jgi:hypothetical protein
MADPFCFSEDGIEVLPVRHFLDELEGEKI